jgi:hypothetical protein
MFLLTSCNDRNKTDAAYYNIDSLLNTQINLLLDNDATVTKSVALNGNTDTVTITRLDSATLANELNHFRKIFSKRTFKIENAPDSKSNLTVRTYKPEIDPSKEQRANDYIRIFFFNSPANLRKIEVVYAEGNIMFSGSKRIRMEFENIYNKVSLINYSIEGKQKMILSDSVHFYIRGDFKIK